ncbi:MAG: hypothetical protein GOMPHAMPRED_001691 [Gomphillus americanus]|uniref:Uncharacterized protein n=1 Tax=Gomphillus americanus TaxID=1940652 RepID=A0A8H3IHQ2_9LECA|nr:MAG: hypothetical protein GOMPHAMPRED_001691 [Gomphillus americanus]
MDQATESRTLALTQSESKTVDENIKLLKRIEDIEAQHEDLRAQQEDLRAQQEDLRAQLEDLRAKIPAFKECTLPILHCLFLQHLKLFLWYLEYSLLGQRTFPCCYAIRFTISPDRRWSLECHSLASTSSPSLALAAVARLAASASALPALGNGRRGAGIVERTQFPNGYSMGYYGILYVRSNLEPLAFVLGVTIKLAFTSETSNEIIAL